VLKATFLIIFFAAKIFFGFAIAGEAGQVRTGPQRWDFDNNPVDQSPTRFSFGRTGSGRVGRWLIKTAKDVPSGANVLAQTDTDATSYRFPVAVADSALLRNARVSVRCKPVSGKVDQACGLVFRYRDENNYYVVRANALENNVRLYFVKEGKRQQFAGWDGPVSNGVWHTLRVEARDDRFEIYWNDKRVIDARDQTFKESGRIGVWTKADSVTHFDDLTVEPLDLGSGNLK
jgi:hypothetical protein